MSKWQILVVEDDVYSQQIVQGLFEYHGITCMVAPNAEQALEVLAGIQDTIPTAIIIDLNLPNMDGWRLLNALQKYVALQNVPKIAVTAYYTPTLARKAIDAGFSAFFPKPLDVTTFITELTAIVEA